MNVSCPKEVCNFLNVGVKTLADVFGSDVEPTVHKALAFNVPYELDSNPAFVCHFKGLSATLFQLLGRVCGLEVRSLGTPEGAPVDQEEEENDDEEEEEEEEEEDEDEVDQEPSIFEAFGYGSAVAKNKKKKKKKKKKKTSTLEAEEEEEEEEEETTSSKKKKKKKSKGSFVFGPLSLPKVLVMFEDLYDCVDRQIGVRVWVLQLDAALNLGTAFSRAVQNGLADDPKPANAAAAKRLADRLVGVRNWYSPQLMETLRDDASLVQEVWKPYLGRSSNMQPDRIDHIKSATSPYQVLSVENAMSIGRPSELRDAQCEIDRYQQNGAFLLDRALRMHAGCFSVVRSEALAPRMLPRIPLPGFVRQQIRLPMQINAHLGALGRSIIVREALARALLACEAAAAAAVEDDQHVLDQLASVDGLREARANVRRCRTENVALHDELLDLPALLVQRECHVLRHVLPAAQMSVGTNNFEESLMNRAAITLRDVLEKRAADDDDDDEAVLDNEVRRRAESGVRVLLAQLSASARASIAGARRHPLINKFLKSSAGSSSSSSSADDTVSAVRALTYLSLMQAGAFGSTQKVLLPARLRAELVDEEQKVCELLLAREQKNMGRWMRLLNDLARPSLSAREVVAIVDEQCQRMSDYRARASLAPDLLSHVLGVDAVVADPTTTSDEPPPPPSGTLKGRMAIVSECGELMRRWEPPTSPSDNDWPQLVVQLHASVDPYEHQRLLQSLIEIAVRAIDDHERESRRLALAKQLYGTLRDSSNATLLSVAAGVSGRSDDDGGGGVESDLMVLDLESENLYDPTGLERLLCQANVSLYLRMRNRFERRRLEDYLKSNNSSDGGGGVKMVLEFRQQTVAEAWRVLVEERQETRLSRPTLAMREYWHSTLSRLGGRLFRECISGGLVAGNLSSFGNLVAGMMNDLDNVFHVSTNFVPVLIIYLVGLGAARHKVSEACHVLLLAGSTQTGKSFAIDLVHRSLGFPNQFQLSTYSSAKADVTEGDHGDVYQMQHEANLEELGLGVSGAENDRHQRWKMRVTEPVMYADVYSTKESDQKQGRKRCQFVARANANSVQSVNASSRIGQEAGGATLARCVWMAFAMGERMGQKREDLPYKTKYSEDEPVLTAQEKMWKLRSWLVYLAEKLIEQAVLDDVDTDVVPQVARLLFDEFQRQHRRPHPSMRQMHFIVDVCRSLALLHAVHVVFFSELSTERRQQPSGDGFRVEDMLLLQPYLYVTDEQVVWVVTAMNGFSEEEERANIIQGVRQATTPPVPPCMAEFSLRLHRDLFAPAADAAGERDWNYVAVRGSNLQYVMTLIRDNSPRSPSVENVQRAITRLTVKTVRARPMRWIAPQMDDEAAGGGDDHTAWFEQHSNLDEDPLEPERFFPMAKRQSAVAPGRPGASEAYLAFHVKLLMQSEVQGLHSIVQAALGHRFQQYTRSIILGSSFVLSNHPEHYVRTRVRTHALTAEESLRVLPEEEGQSGPFAHAVQCIIDEMYSRPLYNVADVVLVVPAPHHTLQLPNNTSPIGAQMAMIFSGPVNSGEGNAVADSYMSGMNEDALSSRINILDLNDLNQVTVARVQNSFRIDAQAAEDAYPPKLFMRLLAARRQLADQYVTTKPVFDQYPHNLVKSLLNSFVQGRAQAKLVGKLESGMADHRPAVFNEYERRLMEQGYMSRLVINGKIPQLPPAVREQIERDDNQRRGEYSSMSVQMLRRLSARPSPMNQNILLLNPPPPATSLTPADSGGGGGAAETPLYSVSVTDFRKLLQNSKRMRFN